MSAGRLAHGARGMDTVASQSVGQKGAAGQATSMSHLVARPGIAARAPFREARRMPRATG